MTNHIKRLDLEFDMARPNTSGIIRSLGRPISFYPGLAKKVGISEAIFLGQLIYWTPKGRNEDGWIYKSAEEIETETSIPYRTQVRLRERLKAMNLIEESYAREEHNLYFRIKEETLDALVSDEEHLTERQVPPDKVAGATCQDGSSHLTERQVDIGAVSTSKNTTGITPSGSDGTSKPKPTETAKPTKVDPDVVFEDARREFRRHARDVGWEATNFGDLTAENRTLWAHVVKEHGKDAVLAAVKTWMEEQRDMPKKFNPVGKFIKRIKEYIEAAAEAGSDEGDGYPDLSKVPD